MTKEETGIILNSKEYKEAKEWALDLDYEKFMLVICLLEEQHKRFDTLIDSFSALNSENTSWIDCIDKLKDFIDSNSEELWNV